MLRFICLGDVVGRPGRSALKRACEELRNDFAADLIIANGENASGGVGIDAKTASEIKAAGVDIITLGDHAWQRHDFRDFIEGKGGEYCIRPANYPEGAPGKGWIVIERQEIKVGVVNLLGRVFMPVMVDCPFRCAEELLHGPLKDCHVRICDFHAEATSEKIAMGRFLSGRFSCVFGTHTHVQTADEAVSPEGTAYITDLGMCGSQAGVIGMDGEVAVSRFLTSLPSSYKTAKGDVF